MRLTVVNGDANAHYLSDSYYWWNNGGIFNPPDWVAYTWMGRPAGSNIQGGSYVLPQGIANGISPVEPYGIVYHVGGARGSWRGGHVPVGPSADRAPPCFADRPRGAILRSGNLCNAQFLDFHRAAAYWPWVLLVISPLWAWHKTLRDSACGLNPVAEFRRHISGAADRRCRVYWWVGHRVDDRLSKPRLDMACHRQHSHRGTVEHRQICSGAIVGNRAARLESAAHSPDFPEPGLTHLPVPTTRP